MVAKSGSQREQDKRTNLLWSVFSGLGLGSIFAVCFYFVLENPSLAFFLDQWWWSVVLAYALVAFLLFFAIGFLRGRATGNLSDGVSISVSASLIQALPALVLLGIFSWAFNFWWFDQYGVLFSLFGTDAYSGSQGAGWYLAETLIVQMLLGLLVALLGGAIGKRFSHQRPSPGEAAQP